MVTFRTMALNVLDVQRDLVAHGYPLPRSTRADGQLDGLMGPETKAALLRFAMEHGVEPADDLETIARILDANPGPRTVDMSRAIVLPILSSFYRVPRPGSVLSFGYDRGLRKTGPAKGTRHHHQGEDFVAPIGTPLYSIAAGGIVTHAHGGNGPARGFGGYGRIVVVHYPGLAFKLLTQPSSVDLALHEDGPGDDLWMLHAHCDKVLVRVGDQPAKGELIATVGNTAFRVEAPNHRCGPHLHGELALLPYPKGFDRKIADYGRICGSAFYRDNGAV